LFGRGHAVPFEPKFSRRAKKFRVTRHIRIR
jgi:hypothetical protein